MAASSETLIIVGIGLYLLPTLIAAARDKTHGAAGVFLLNIFLGWTLIGWLVAFMWACSAMRRHAASDRLLVRFVGNQRPLLRLTGWMPEQARHRTPT